MMMEFSAVEAVGVDLIQVKFVHRAMHAAECLPLLQNHIRTDLWWTGITRVVT